MSRECVLFSLGRVPYEKALKSQRELLARRCEGTLAKDCLLLLEHEPVFTLGRHARKGKILVTSEFLSKRSIEVRKVERGGDITFHGPGQLVAYPIVDLGKASLSVKEFVNRLEEVMIRTAFDFGVDAARRRGRPGIWVDRRKLGNVGIAVRHGVTFHGLSLNVRRDCLEPFGWIVPCGWEGTRMTSLERISGEETSMSAVEDRMAVWFCRLFQWKLISPKEVDYAVEQALLAQTSPA